jgi:lysyl-tRNA synthetase class 2
VSVAEIVHARAALNRTIRAFFEERGFVEVETPALVDAAGTDPHLEPVSATLNVDREVRPMWLHTSPEFAMKELLVEGLERIYQLCHVWRDGEVTAQHNPEFTILEWYRAGSDYHAIMDDVETLVRRVLPRAVDVAIPAYEGRVVLEDFERVTMREAWAEACGLDPVETAGDVEALEAAAREAGVSIYRSGWQRWDELFHYLMLEAVEPWLKGRGAVFVTEWPTQLAVLARRCPHDERVAERFELYLGGVEVANGFGELTDPVEQQARFESDNAERRALGKVEQPIPERFLGALRRGLPRSSGVALGVDRLLMLQTGRATIADVLPFAIE